MDTKNNKVIWLTGLSGSGKSTLALNVHSELKKLNIQSKIFDGDIFRNNLNKDLGFSLNDRKENIRRVAEVVKLFKDENFVCLVSFISPTNNIRNMAKDIIGRDDYSEVFVNCPLGICEQRDVKGLYKKARAGEIKMFTGIDSPFDIPDNPQVVVKTDVEDIEVSTKRIVEYIISL